MPFFETANLRIDLDGQGKALLWLDIPDRPYNVLNRQVLRDLDAALDRVGADQTVRLLAVLSGKDSGFLAGADLNEFATITSADQAMTVASTGQGLFEKLANLRVPTVAVIEGVCLGGGLELALACDYRVVVNRRGSQIGFPEIELGLLPAWGGTQRFPRTVGIERAVGVILQRQRVTARQALEWGLADRLVASRDEAVAALGQFVDGDVRPARKRRLEGGPLRTWRQRLLESTSIGRSLLFRGVERIMRRRVPDDMPAPWEALTAMRLGITRGMPAGLAYEREAVGRLARTSACRNLMTLFFLIERARKDGLTAPAAQPVSIRRVGVVGAGTMGAGIAQLAAVKGFEVVVHEADERALAAAGRRLEDLFEKAVKNGVLSADDARQKLARIRKTVSFECFGEVDLAVEAVVEDPAKKKDIFKHLERVTRPDAILATNTSSLSVADMQGVLTDPGRLGGLHFFNPVHKMPLVEVVRGPKTADRTTAALVQWASDLGKTPVVMRDSPGFIVNRILFPYLNEAGMLVAEGMPVEQVDQIMRRFGMPMGPLELIDQVGADIAAHAARSMAPLFAGRIAPHAALDGMCDRGWLGQKAGRGFYVYGAKKKAPNAELATALGGLSGDAAPPNRASPDAAVEARERMVLLMVNEAAACLAEGLGERAEVIDLAMVLGTGWAPHRGGPLRYADHRGPADIVAALARLRGKFGPRFEPCAALADHARSQSPFYEPLTLAQGVS